MALLAGLIRCGRCGRKLRVSYSGSSKIVRYHCKGGQINHGVAWCISFAGRKVDEAVVARVLEALLPAGVTAVIEAWERLSQAEDETRRQLRLAVERARYEADRCRRQYDSADPENRLVTAELERRWEEALAELKGLESRLAEVDVRREAVGESERQRLLKLGGHLEAAWPHPEAPVTLKKRILRSVLEEIVADISDDPPEILLHLHWVGGDHTRLTVRKNRPGKHSRCTERKVGDLIEELVQVSEASVRRLLRCGILPGQQVVAHAPWVIQPQNLELPDVSSAVEALRSRRKLPSSVSEQGTIPLFSTTS